MARFIATIQGQAGPASRLGSANSGIEAHPRGWNLGVRVEGYADGDEDVFRVWVTSGSGYGGPADIYLGAATRGADGALYFIPAYKEATP